MPEEIRKRMENLKQILPAMDDVSLAMLAGYADGYAAGAEREAKKHGEVPDQSAGGSVA